MREIDHTYIISTILNCGYGDTQAMLARLEAYEVEFDDAWEYAKDNFAGVPDINSLIYSIYRKATKNAIDIAITEAQGEGLEFDETEVIQRAYDKRTTEINSIASYLHIDGEAVFDKDSLRDAMNHLVYQLIENEEV